MIALRPDQVGGTLEKDWEPSGLPQIRSFLVNVDCNNEDNWGIHNRLLDFSPPAFHTVLTNAHQGARAAVGHAFPPGAKYHLVVNSAPTSLAAFEFRSLAREMLRAVQSKEPA